jgi:uncharacterized cysteine cluster protein YcgN (CxxCxxCC family)
MPAKVNANCGEKWPKGAIRTGLCARFGPPHDGTGRSRYKAREGPLMPHDQAPFWRTKSLEQMTRTEWESLCDGCGRCCLNKLEDIDTGATHFTDVGCKLLDDESCRCKDYARRKAKVPDCVKLTARNVRRIVWLPPTCAYRLVAEGRDLYWWHPLVSGDPEMVHAAGVSVRGRVKASELDVPDDKLEDYIVNWPGKVPKRARRRKGK